MQNHVDIMKSDLLLLIPTGYGSSADLVNDAGDIVDSVTFEVAKVYAFYYIFTYNMYFDVQVLGNFSSLGVWYRHFALLSKDLRSVLCDHNVRTSCVASSSIGDSVNV